MQTIGNIYVLSIRITLQKKANFIFLYFERKQSKKLGQNWNNGIPIEVSINQLIKYIFNSIFPDSLWKKQVLPSAYRLVKETIERKHQGKAILREFSGAKSKAVNIPGQKTSYT